MGETPKDYVVIGQILKPRGTRGKVDVLCLSDFPERFKPGLRVFLVPPLPRKKELVISEVSSQPKGLVLAFEGLDSRNDAESLRERYIAVPKSEAPALPEETYWIDDIVGLEVVSTDGARIGKVKEVLKGRGQDVYVVEGEDGKERLIPAVKEIVKKVDVPAGKIVIRPIPGLLD